jgi:hypothetical protein
MVLAWLPASVWAQASLAAEDKIDEVVVTLNGVQEAFTVVRDARIPEQWYYVPDRPRLFERTVDGQTEPEFHLIRFQFKDPANPQALLEGGMLQFAASLALPPEALPQLTAAISQKATLPPERIRLAALPLKSANVTLYTQAGVLVTSAPQGAGIAPTFATQKMVFSVPLTKIGADVFDELVRGNTGIPVVVDFTYDGLTPAAGFKVHVDWDQTYQFYSRHDHFAASVNYKGLFGASVDVDRQKLREALEESKAIEIEIIEGSGFTKADADKLLEPFINRINAELLEDLKPPEKIQPAQAAQPPKAGTFGGVSYSVAIKDVQQVKKGKETIDFNIRMHQERKTLAGGFMGIGRYPEQLRPKLVTVVPPGPWKSAFFVLPAVGDADELGIDQVDLQIGLKHGDQIDQTQVVIWQPDDKGWRDQNGTSRTVLAFGLMGLGGRNADLQNVTFESRAQITIKGEVISLSQAHKVFDGETAITTPLSDVEVVAVDGSVLSWRKLSPESELVFANVKLQSSGRTFTRQLKPRNLDGKFVEPAPLYWLVQKSAEPVTATIKFGLNSGKLIDWQHNGADLKQALASLQIMLLDSDWQ